MLAVIASLTGYELNAATNLFVALDGTGQFTNLQQAIMAVPAGTKANPVNIFIKAGVYRELIYIQREKRFFHLVGEDPKTTIISFNLDAKMTGLDGKAIGTFHTATAVIDADDFTAEGLTFENSAGPVGQALAVRIEGDRGRYGNCRFLGWQDTMFVNRGRQYFENCYIEGHVDFIFGGATCFFEKCYIRCLGNGYITAASTPDNAPFGFVFSNCTITGKDENVKTYLGRPWRDYAAVTFLNTDMSAVVRPEGWNNWKLPQREKTSRYAEYNSTGLGATPDARVPWAKKLTKSQAKKITVKSVLGGSDNWNPMEERLR
jgi:pectinesterase